MGVKFFVDNNIGYNLVKGLRELGYSNIEHLTEAFDASEEDEVWLKYVGENQLILITKDKKIRHNPKEKDILKRYKVVAFFLGGEKMSTKEISKQIINIWEKMEAQAKIQLKKGVAGAFQIPPHGGKIKEIPLSD